MDKSFRGLRSISLEYIDILGECQFLKIPTALNDSILVEELDTGRMLQNKHYSGAIVHELDIIWSPHGRNI
jgi:hypothetical protein